MTKIIGNTTTTPTPRSDWAQTDATKADFIKNKPNLTNLVDKQELDGLSQQLDVTKANAINALSMASDAIQSATQATQTANTARIESINAGATATNADIKVEQALAKTNENARKIEEAKTEAKDWATAEATAVLGEAKSYTNQKFNGANKSVSFYNYNDLYHALTNTEMEQMHQYSIGQNFYIKALHVPDLWVYTSTEYMSDFVYTTDEDFINRLKTDGYVHVGKYVLSVLETQKADLTEYATLKEVHAFGEAYDRDIERINNRAEQAQSKANENAQKIAELPTKNDLNEYAKTEDVNTELSKKLTSFLPPSGERNSWDECVTITDGTGAQRALDIGGTSKTMRNNAIARYWGDNITDFIPQGVLVTGTPKTTGACANKKYVDDNFVALKSKNTITGSLELPNSPDNPETASVTDTYTTRETANADTTGLTVVDGSTTLVEEIKGGTVRCENLIPYPYRDTTKTGNGLTFTDNGDGSIAITGSATAWVNFMFCEKLPIKPSTTYTMSYGVTSNLRELYLSSNITFRDNDKTTTRIVEINDATQYTFTTQENEYFIDIDIKRGANDVAINTTVYPMLNEGSTALPCQPYFTDLKNAQISGIKSSGRNLINVLPIEIGWNTEYVTNNKDGSFSIRVYNASTEDSLSTYAPNLKAGETYTLTLQTEEGGGKYIHLLGSRRTWRSGNSITLTQADLDNGFNLYGKESWSGPQETPTRIWDIMINKGETALPYQPYVEDTMYLPKTLELGEWDSFNPQTGEITRKTKTLVLNGTEGWYIGGTSTASSTGECRMAFGVSDVYRHPSSGTVGNIKCNNYNTYSGDNVYMKKEGIATYNGEISFYDKNFNTNDISLWKAHLAELYANGTPLTISYELATPIIEKLENVPVGYNVYDGGTETILGNENEKYGTKLTVTQTYSIHENPSEAATKAYVNNGLAKKLDKTGGTITGHLIVENGTTTTVPSVVVKNNENTYGLVLEDDAYKLGKGTVDEKGSFQLDDGEGLPIALRDDSSEFTDGHIVKWSSDGNKFVDGGEAGSGGGLYQHNITFEFVFNGDRDYVNTIIYTNSSSIMTLSSFSFGENFSGKLFTSSVIELLFLIYRSESGDIAEISYFSPNGIEYAEIDVINYVDTITEL